MASTEGDCYADMSIRAWQRYNERLLQLSDPDRTIGVLFAPNTSHFIQKDNPGFVAEQIETLVHKVGNQ